MELTAEMLQENQQSFERAKHQLDVARNKPAPAGADGQRGTPYTQDQLAAAGLAQPRGGGQNAPQGNQIPYEQAVAMGLIPRHVQQPSNLMDDFEARALANMRAQQQAQQQAQPQAYGHEDYQQHPHYQRPPQSYDQYRQQPGPISIPIPPQPDPGLAGLVQQLMAQLQSLQNQNEMLMQQLMNGGGNHGPVRRPMRASEMGKEERERVLYGGHGIVG